MSAAYTWLKAHKSQYPKKWLQALDCNKVEFAVFIISVNSRVSDT